MRFLIFRIFKIFKIFKIQSILLILAITLEVKAVTVENILHSIEASKNHVQMVKGGQNKDIERILNRAVEEVVVRLKVVDAKIRQHEHSAQRFKFIKIRNAWVKALLAWKNYASAYSILESSKRIERSERDLALKNQENRSIQRMKKVLNKIESTANKVKEEAESFERMVLNHQPSPDLHQGPRPMRGFDLFNPRLQESEVADAFFAVITSYHSLSEAYLKQLMIREIPHPSVVEQVKKMKERINDLLLEAKSRKKELEDNEEYQEFRKSHCH